MHIQKSFKMPKMIIIRIRKQKIMIIMRQSSPVELSWQNKSVSCAKMQRITKIAEIHLEILQAIDIIYRSKYELGYQSNKQILSDLIIKKILKICRKNGISQQNLLILCLYKVFVQFFLNNRKPFECSLEKCFGIQLLISIPMSKYIHIPDKVGEWQEQHRQVISGTLSKLAMFNSTLFNLENSNPKYLRQKVSLRIKKQQASAQINHGQSLCENYLKLKHGLKVYARSKSYKVEKVFQTEHGQKKVEEKHKQIRNTHSMAKNDRTIFIDRKYNKQFAIQTAVASQINSINAQKGRIRKAMSEQYMSPLTKQTRILCMNSLLMNIDTEKQKNPLGIHQIKNNGLKKRKKDFEKVYIFNKGKKGAD